MRAVIVSRPKRRIRHGTVLILGTSTHLPDPCSDALHSAIATYLISDLLEAIPGCSPSIVSKPVAHVHAIESCDAVHNAVCCSERRGF
jgi:hypothetical protein